MILIEILLAQVEREDAILYLSRPGPQTCVISAFRHVLNSSREWRFLFNRSCLFFLRPFFLLLFTENSSFRIYNSQKLFQLYTQPNQRCFDNNLFHCSAKKARTKMLSPILDDDKFGTLATFDFVHDFISPTPIIITHLLSYCNLWDARPSLITIYGDPDSCKSRSDDISRPSGNLRLQVAKRSGRINVENNGPIGCRREAKSDARVYRRAFDKRAK